MDQLVASLLDLLRELDGRGVLLTVGGGFGLYLKRIHLARTGQQTLFTELPEVRSTNDIDMFLAAEVLADLSRTKEVADAIERLGYQVVEEAKYLQWKRPVSVGGIAQEVKIDVLVGPLGRYRGSMKVSPPRARPMTSDSTRTPWRRRSTSRTSQSACRWMASLQTVSHIAGQFTCPRPSRTS